MKQPNRSIEPTEAKASPNVEIKLSSSPITKFGKKEMAEIALLEAACPWLKFQIKEGHEAEVIENFRRSFELN